VGKTSGEALCEKNSGCPLVDPPLALMSNCLVTVDEFAEMARSASEASTIRLQDLDLTRYQSPSAQTCYPLEYAFHLLGDIRDQVVVDLGCGSGEELVPLRQRGAKVIGIDISPHLIAIAGQRLRKYKIDAELHVASAYDTHLPDQSVDVVFCMSVLHHLQLDRANDEICRILKPRGLFIFKEPICFSWTMKRLRPLFPFHADNSQFEHPLDSKEINAVTRGFQVVASRSFRSPLVPLLTRLIKPPQLRKWIWSGDAWWLTRVPWLTHFATVRVMALRRLDAVLDK